MPSLNRVSTAQEARYVLQSNSLFCLEFVVHLIEVFHPDSMRDHLERIDLAALDALKEVFPVALSERCQRAFRTSGSSLACRGCRSDLQMDWSLTIADEPDPAFHDRA